MAFGEKVRQYIFRYIRELGIGCGIFVILIGVSIFITEINLGIKISTSIGCILLGISLITMNLLEWKPLLMLTCTVVALGLALWILVFTPGDDPTKHVSVVQQEIVEAASKPNGVLNDAASSEPN